MGRAKTSENMKALFYIAHSQISLSRKSFCYISKISQVILTVNKMVEKEQEVHGGRVSSTEKTNAWLRLPQISYELRIKNCSIFVPFLYKGIFETMNDSKSFNLLNWTSLNWWKCFVSLKISAASWTSFKVAPSLWQRNKMILRSSQQLNHAKPQHNNALTRAKVKEFSKTYSLPASHKPCLHTRNLCKCNLS